jgi:RimJ/RimL family protein N-acetyltransferase
MLDRIYIHPTVWGHGHGKVLIEWCEQAVKSMGLGQITLWVFEVNERARHVYEKHGYKLDGKCKEDFKARILRYSKALSL